MGKIHWNDLSGRKRWGKAHAEKKRELFSIAQKYRLTRDTKPEIIADNSPYYTFDSFEYDAKNWADSKYAHTPAVSGWGAQLLTVTLTIVIAVASVLAVKVTGGQSLWAAINAGSISASIASAMIGGAVLTSLTIHFITADIQNSANRKKIQEGIIKHRQSAQDFKTLSKERSTTLSTLMIYGKYDIYANGNIYNSGRAGSSLGGDNSYCPSKAYDPTSGLRGEIAQNSVDDSITYRAHTNLAGNRDFMQSTLGTNFPLANNSINHRLNDEQTNKTMTNRLSEISEGFEKLVDAGAGLVFKHGLEKTSNPQNAYNQILKQEIGFYKNKLMTSDFLQKQEHYKNGLWADFMFLYFKDTTLQKESAIKNTIAHLNNWETEESKALRQQASEKELVKMVIESLIYSLETTNEFLKGNIYIWTNVGYANTKVQDDRILEYFSVEKYAKNARDVHNLYNYFIAWLDKSKLYYDFNSNTYNKFLNPTFSKDELRNYSILHTYLDQAHMGYDYRKISKINHLITFENKFKFKVISFFPNHTPQELRIFRHTFSYSSGFTMYECIGLDVAGVNDEYMKALCRYKWDSRLDSIDLSAYSLEDLGLA